jgi:hypothetical protein
MAFKFHRYVWQSWSQTGVAPHSAAQRIAYTVPSDYKSVAVYVNLYLVRATAATTVGESRLYVTVTPAGGSETTVLITGMNNNSVGARAGTTQTMGFYLGPGDIVKVYSSDASTGGAIDYYASIQLVQWR